MTTSDELMSLYDLYSSRPSTHANKTLTLLQDTFSHIQLTDTVMCRWLKRKYTRIKNTQGLKNAVAEKVERNLHNRKGGWQ